MISSHSPRCSPPCYHGYFVVLATFFNRLSTIGIFYSLGLYVTYFEGTFGISTAEAALIPGLVGGIAFLCVVLMGRVQDELALRGHSISWSYACSGLILLVGSVAGSYSQTYGQLIGCSIMIGFGIGLPAYGSGSVLVQWFVKRKGTSLSLGASGAGIGILVYSLFVEKLLVLFNGSGEVCAPANANPDACNAWRQAMFVTGIAVSAVIMICSISMRLPKEGEVEEFESGPQIDEPDEETGEENESEELHEENGNSEHKEVFKRRTDILKMGASRRDLAVGVLADILVEESRNAEINNLPSRRRSAGRTMSTRRRPAPSRQSSIFADVRQSIVLDASRRTRVDLLEAGGRGSLANLAMRKQPSVQNVLSAVSTRNSTFLQPVLEAELQEWENEDAEDYRGSGLSLTLKETIFTKTYFLIGFWALVASISYDTVFLLIPLSAKENGLSESDGAIALSLCGIFGLIGNLTIGFFADVFGCLRTLQLSMNMCMLTTVAWPFCQSSWSLWLVMSLYSYFAAAFPLHVAVLSDAYSTSSKTVILTAFGLVQTLNAPGTFLGPVISGALVQVSDNFLSAALFLAGCYLVGNSALCFVPAPDDQIRMMEAKYGRKESGAETLPSNNAVRARPNSRTGKSVRFVEESADRTMEY